MTFWSRPALLSYVAAFLGMAGFDWIWDALAPDLSSIMKTHDGALSEAALRQLRIWGAVLPWAELAAMLATLAFVVRIGPNLERGAGFSYVVLVTFLMTLGRELLGTRVAFTSTFGFRVALAWIIVLGTVLIWRRRANFR